jgi:hypothetical protein
MKKVILSLLILTGFQLAVTAQKDSTKAKKNYKNTIRYNITNPIIFGGKSQVFGYERVINKRQSFSINIGSQGFPSLNLISNDSIKANTILDDKGFNFSADYRFYLSKENKYGPPRGVYIGPYYSYNKFENKRSWTVTSTAGGAPKAVDATTSLSVNTVGFEMGYQFILWNRVSLDMILAGPGVAGYNFKAELGSNLSQADKEKLLGAINDALAEKFPGYGFVIDETDFQKKGTEKTTSFGFRYMIMVGFRF